MSGGKFLVSFFVAIVALWLAGGAAGGTALLHATWGFLCAQARACGALLMLPRLGKVSVVEFAVQVVVYSFFVAVVPGLLLLYRESVDRWLLDAFFRHALLRATVRHFFVDAVKPDLLVLWCTVVSSVLVEWFLGAELGGDAAARAVVLPWPEWAMRMLTYFTPTLLFYIVSLRLVDLSRLTPMARNGVTAGVFGVLFFSSAVYRLLPVLYTRGGMSTVHASWAAVFRYPVPTMLHGLVSGVPSFLLANWANNKWCAHTWLDVLLRITVQLVATCVLTMWSIEAGNGLAAHILDDAPVLELATVTVVGLRLLHVAMTVGFVLLYVEALRVLHVTSPLLKIDVAWPSQLSIESGGATIASLKQMYEFFRGKQRDPVKVMLAISKLAKGYVHGKMGKAAALDIDMKITVPVDNAAGRPFKLSRAELVAVGVPLGVESPWRWSRDEVLFAEVVCESGIEIGPLTAESIEIPFKMRIHMVGLTEALRLATAAMNPMDGLRAPEFCGVKARAAWARVRAPCSRSVFVRSCFCRYGQEGGSHRSQFRC